MFDMERDKGLGFTI